MSDAGDFHEPDEPVGDVIAAFKSGEKRVTAMPAAGQTANLVVNWGRPRGRTEYLMTPDRRLLVPVAGRPKTQAAAG